MIFYITGRAAVMLPFLFLRIGRGYVLFLSRQEKYQKNPAKGR